LLLSLLPHIIDRRLLPRIRPLAALGALLVFIALVMTISLGIKHSLASYATWKLSGGNCPVVIESCGLWTFVGCGLQHLNTSVGMTAVEVTPANPNTQHANNILAVAETALGILLAAPFIICWPCAIVGGVGVLAWGSLWSCLSLAQRGREELTSRDLEKNAETLAATCKISMVLIIGYALTALALHAYQQAQPKSISIVDSFGSLAHAQLLYDSFGDLIPNQPYYGGNASHWSDCFIVQTPVDRFGFLKAWWLSHWTDFEVILSIT
jgi:hypothetical protein